MERARTLVVHYSRTGNTRRVGRAIAEALGADVEEIRDRTDRSGIPGFLRSALEALLRSFAPIDRPRRDPADYDLVVVGTPVWTGSVSSPVRTWLWLERDRLPAVAFFATVGGGGSERAFGQMREIAGKAPVATLSLSQRDLARGVPRERVADLVRRIAAARRRPRRGKRLRAAS